MSEEIDAVKETAKAGQEIAKVTGKVVDAAHDVGCFIAKYVGGSVEQGIGIFEDKLKYLRWERQMRLVERANAFLKSRGLDSPTRAVPLNLAIPLLQGASIEEDNELQDRWAALLVNAADANRNVQLRRAFVSILEDMTSLDAAILEKLCHIDPATAMEGIWTRYLPTYATVEKPPKDDQMPPREVEVSLENLARLGCITAAMTWGGGRVVSNVNPTTLGREFVNACSL